MSFRKSAATERSAQPKLKTNVVFAVETTLTAEQLKEPSPARQRKLVRAHGKNNNVTQSPDADIFTHLVNNFENLSQFFSCMSSLLLYVYGCRFSLDSRSL